MNKKIKKIILIILVIVILLFGYLIISDNQKITGESIFSKFTKKVSNKQIQSSRSSGGTSTSPQSTYWNVTYDGNFLDHAEGVGVDSDGNVYVTGCSRNENGDYDYLTIKYDSDGNEIWTKRYDHGDHDWARDIAVDSSGNVYVTGRSKSSWNFDYYTIKYDSEGNEIWNTRYNTGEDQEIQDYAEGIGVDSDENVYVTGTSNLRYYTVKYDSEGNEIWNATYNSYNGGFDDAKDIAVDSNGNVYVTGYIEIEDPDYNYLTVKYDSEGNEIWIKEYGDSGKDKGESVAVDSSGNVYVTGYSNYNYLTIKYDSNGNEIWIKQYNGIEIDSAEDIFVDTYGNIYVTGTSYVWGNGYDYLTIKYDSNGNEIWVKNHDGVGGSDNAKSVVVDSNGDVYLTGYSNNNYLTIKMQNSEFYCGNNIVEGNEECDGTDLNGETCVSLGHAGGNLACEDSCVFNEIQCYEKTGWGWGWFTR